MGELSNLRVWEKKVYVFFTAGLMTMKGDTRENYPTS